MADTGMKTRAKPIRRAALAAGLLACVAAAPMAAAQDQHLINLRDADIHAFIEDVSRVTGYRFIIHPAVRGKVTIISNTPMSEEEVFDMFLSTLRTYDYTAILADNGNYRIVPDDNASEDALIVGAADSPESQFVTEVFRLDHFSALEAAQMVQPLVNGRGQVTANSESNILVIVDYAGNIERIRQIVNEVDRDSSVMRTVRLQNMPAAEMAAVVNGMSAERRGREGAAGGVTAVAVESGNSVLLRGNRADVLTISDMVQELDRASTPTETLRVIYLKHANAEEIVPILEAVAASRAGPDGATGVKIPFDAATNAVVLSMDPQTVSEMARVIAELDVRRAQVLVEAIIVEVSDDTARELGLQFVLADEDGGSTPFASSNFSRSAPSILSLTGALLLDDDEGNANTTLRDAALSSLIGAQGLTLGVGGQNDDGLLFGAILSAVEADSRSNVLSTPSITTLDNEEARILVGQEVSVSTGRVLGDDFANPFQTNERRDIGVQLEVKPTITEGDTIRLDLRQEVSSIAGNLSAAADDFVFNKREIENTVLADDGEVIVLGGLIELTEEDSVSKIPLLGDIPLAGRLFRTEGKSQARKNLVVFIRPTIIRDRDTMRDTTDRKFDYIRGQTLSSGLDLDAFIDEAGLDLSKRSGSE